ncbi:MAG: hypothetical protein RLZZ612_389 [Pseudomonadota bacterium]|jgi:uncharacterized protein YidB (DUF937 family)
MGLMDALLGAAGQMATQAMQQQTAPQAGGADVLGMVGQLLQQSGGISGVAQRLQSNGMGDAVQSWIGTGQNQAVGGDALMQALGPDLINGVLAKFGGGNLSPEISQLIASALPMVIDQLTPDGQVPHDNGMGSLGNLGALAGLAGQLFGNRT